MGDLPEGGAAATAGLMTAGCSPSFLESNPSEICQENWAAADKATRELIRKVQPTPVSEDRRRKVVDYIQRLIRNCLGAEVFTYGSVPLKTYLPDGDIDLTAFGGANVEDTLVDDVRLVLEEEGKNTASEFVVKDVQIIRAEVKIVKCIVQDIVVDISFNQIGGLCTLCFLEQVDRLIGKDHLFKRSIILIKAWCYYESRILGAHHGLISTYALETLVLYIFRFFHSTLDGPLAVLYKFLDYFSKFDWDTYCISLHGLVRISSMPEIVAEMPEDCDQDLLLSNDFLSSCVGKFSVPSTSGDKTLRAFQLKHLNIVDPLKEMNNLGRSVSKGNFYRIRSAFSYGARKLALILWQPKISIANELYKFFPNTMARHGGGQRPDVQDFEPSQFLKRPISGVHIPETVLPKIHNSYEFDGRVNSSGFQHTSGRLSKDLTKEMESTSSQMGNSKDHNSSVLKYGPVLQNREQPSKPSVLDPSSCEDSNNLNASSLGTPKGFPDSSMNQTPAAKDAVRAVPKPLLCLPHLYFSKSKVHDDSVKDVNQDSDTLYKYDKNASSSISVGADGSRGAVVGGCLDNKQLVDSEAVASMKPNTVLSAPKSSSTSESPNYKDMEPYSACGSDTPESLSSTDLTGDYDGYFRCLQYGRWYCEYGSTVHSLHVPPLPSAVYQNNSLWDGLPPLPHFKQNGFSHRHLNGFHPNQPMYAMRPVLIPGVAFGWEEAPKPKGTGTYIPNMNQSVHGYKSTTTKGKSQAASRSPSSNEQHMPFVTNMVDRRRHEIPPPQVPVEKSLEDSSIPNHGSFLPHKIGFPKVANGSRIQPEPVVESDDVGHGPGSSVLGQTRQQMPVPVSPLGSSGAQKSEPPLSKEQDRIPLRSSYHLRDEDDFPPLSVQNGVERLSVV